MEKAKIIIEFHQWETCVPVYIIKITFSGKMTAYDPISPEYQLVTLLKG